MATNRGFSIRDLKAFGFNEIGSTEYSVDATGETNITRVHLVQPGIQLALPSQLVDAYDAGVPFESREIESPFSNFTLLVNVTTSPHTPPDNRALGPQAGKLYLAEGYFRNPYGDELWLQIDHVICQSIGISVPRGQFMTRAYSYRGIRSREVHSNTFARINGKP